MGTLFQIAVIKPHHRFITDTENYFLLRPKGPGEQPEEHILAKTPEFDVYCISSNK